MGGNFARSSAQAKIPRSAPPTTTAAKHSLAASMAGMKRKSVANARAQDERVATKTKQADVLGKRRKLTPQPVTLKTEPDTGSLGESDTTDSSASDGGVDLLYLDEEQAAIFGPNAQERGEAETDSDPIIESDTTEHSGIDDGVSWPSDDDELVPPKAEPVKTAKSKANDVDSGKPKSNGNSKGAASNSGDTAGQCSFNLTYLPIIAIIADEDSYSNCHGRS